MAKPPLTRAELIELFWQSEAPAQLAEACSAYRALFYRFQPFTISEHPGLPPADVGMLSPPPEEVLFYLEGRPFGPDEMFVTVCANGMALVRPFPLSQREFLPAHYPLDFEEEAAALS